MYFYRRLKIHKIYTAYMMYLEHFGGEIKKVSQVATFLHT